MPYSRRSPAPAAAPRGCSRASGTSIPPPRLTCSTCWRGSTPSTHEAAMKQLSPKHMLYIQHRATGKSARESARLAGYSPSHSKNAAEKLDRHHLIAPELAKVRGELQQVTKF